MRYNPLQTWEVIFKRSYCFQVIIMDKNKFCSGTAKNVLYSFGFFIYIYWNYCCPYAPCCEILNYSVNMVMRYGCYPIVISNSALQQKIGGTKYIICEFTVSKRYFRIGIRVESNKNVVRMQMGTIYRKLENVPVFYPVLGRFYSSYKMGLLDFLYSFLREMHKILRRA